MQDSQYVGEMYKNTLQCRCDRHGHGWFQCCGRETACKRR